MAKRITQGMKVTVMSDETHGTDFCCWEFTRNDTLTDALDIIQSGYNYAQSQADADLLDRVATRIIERLDERIEEEINA